MDRFVFCTVDSVELSRSMAERGSFLLSISFLSSGVVFHFFVGDFLLCHPYPVSGTDCWIPNAVLDLLISDNDFYLTGQPTHQDSKV
jgi:hypothetical protein